MSTITGLTSNALINAQQLVRMQQQLNDLSMQMSTGKTAQTYGGLGINTGLAVNTSGQISALNSYLNSISIVNTRIQLQNSALDQLNTISQQTQAAMFSPQNFTLVSNGQTSGQIQANGNFDEALSLLNTQAGNTYLFSGNATGTPATTTPDSILNGDALAAGLKQVISERLQADQGADGRGRLDPPSVAGTAVTLAEDGVTPFGFKLAGATTNIAGATVTGPVGSPPSLTIDLGGTNPSEGTTVNIQLTLPDGTSTSINLTATSTVPPPNGSFAIGATAADTAANLATAIDTQVQNLAQTDLVGASAIAASNNFFDLPAQRVDGPPFDTATSLRNATATDTVQWYTGDNGAGDPRSTMSATLDNGITVNYGVRANEQALRNVVQNLATLAAVSFSPSDPNASAAYNALSQRIGANLTPSATAQQISSIQTELAGANDTASTAQTSINAKIPILQNVLSGIENADPNLVGSELLALQTQMQGSLQITSMLSKLSLVNFM